MYMRVDEIGVSGIFDEYDVIDVLVQNADLYRDPILSSNCEKCFIEIAPIVLMALLCGSLVTLFFVGLFKAADKYNISMLAIFKCVVLVIALLACAYIAVFMSYIEALWALTVIVVFCYAQRKRKIYFCLLTKMLGNVVNFDRSILFHCV